MLASPVHVLSLRGPQSQFHPPRKAHNGLHPAYLGVQESPSSSSEAIVTTPGFVFCAAVETCECVQNETRVDNIQR